MHLIRLQLHRAKVERIRTLEYQNKPVRMHNVIRCNQLIAKIDTQIAAQSNTQMHPILAQILSNFGMS